MNATHECDQCGACCQGLPLVFADSYDAEREPRLLSLPQAVHAGLTLEYLREQPGRRVIPLAIRWGSACPFLTSQHRCRIYATRPGGCASFTAGSSLCQKARSLAGLPPLQSRTLLECAEDVLRRGKELRCQLEQQGRALQTQQTVLERTLKDFQQSYWSLAARLLTEPSSCRGVTTAR